MPTAAFKYYGHMIMNNQMQVFPKGDRRDILRCCPSFVSQRVISYFICFVEFKRQNSSPERIRNVQVKHCDRCWGHRKVCLCDVSSCNLVCSSGLWHSNLVLSPPHAWRLCTSGWCRLFDSGTKQTGREGTCILFNDAVITDIRTRMPVPVATRSKA